MPKFQLTDVPLFPEKSVSSSSAETNVPPAPNVSSSSSHSVKSSPLTVPSPAKRRRFPKPPVCTDDIRPSSDYSFSSMDLSSALHGSSSSSKSRRSNLGCGFTKSVSFDLSANSSSLSALQNCSSPKSKHLLPIWPPSTG